jgi:murein DD-endopeptidase MepM/ murein hydrolase activator NlpD
LGICGWEGYNPVLVQGINGMNKITSRWFNLISWGITLLLVFAAGGFAFWRMRTLQTVAVAPIPAATKMATGDLQAVLPTENAAVMPLSALERNLTLKTIIPARPRFDIIKHTVELGDSVFAISKSFSIKPDSLLWANYDLLNGSPDSLRPGQELNVPPTDGILYQWKAGDTLDKVAMQYKAKADDILNWPGNNIDLTNPIFKAGDLVMIPGGSREYVDWLPAVPVRAKSGTASLGGVACSGGAVGGGGFVWPADNHSLSGNDYSDSHRGIDIAAGMGANVYAADSGVVVLAGGVTSGYGNVIYIDHGDGYSTVYAHLSQINVKVCQSVSRGQLIGLAGSTGNSTGAHLHFEVRKGGVPINPWYVLGQ